MKRLLGGLVLCIMVFYGCSSGAFQKVSEDKFIGIWEIIGRKNLEGIQIEIQKNNKKELEGRVIKRNNNKLVNMFIDSNEVFIKRIERASNYQFVLVEKKLGHTLFSIYGIDTEAKYEVEFNGEAFINFSKNSDNKKVGYKKVK